MFGRRIHASQSGGFADAPANGRYMSWPSLATRTNKQKPCQFLYLTAFLLFFR